MPRLLGGTPADGGAAPAADDEKDLQLESPFTEPDTESSDASPFGSPDIEALVLGDLPLIELSALKRISPAWANACRRVLCSDQYHISADVTLDELLLYGSSPEAVVRFLRRSDGVTKERMASAMSQLIARIERPLAAKVSLAPPPPPAPVTSIPPFAGGFGGFGASADSEPPSEEETRRLEEEKVKARRDNEQTAEAYARDAQLATAQMHALLGAMTREQLLASHVLEAILGAARSTESDKAMSIDAAPIRQAPLSETQVQTFLAALAACPELASAPLGGAASLAPSSDFQPEEVDEDAQAGIDGWNGGPLHHPRVLYERRLVEALLKVDPEGAHRPCNGYVPLENRPFSKGIPKDDGFWMLDGDLPLTIWSRILVTATPQQTSLDCKEIEKPSYGYSPGPPRTVVEGTCIVAYRLRDEERDAQMCGLGAPARPHDAAIEEDDAVLGMLLEANPEAAKKPVLWGGVMRRRVPS